MSGIEAAFFGNLNRDAERKTSGAGKAYLRASLRVGDGDKVQWINLTVFDQEAIAHADKFLKGAAIYAEGRLTLDTWKGQDGVDRHGLSVLSWHCRLAQIGRNKPRKKTSSTTGQTNAATAQTPQRAAELDDEIPF
jgi:single-stranded DNA-binding protein